MITNFNFMTPEEFTSEEVQKGFNIPDNQEGGYYEGTWTFPKTNAFGRKFIGAVTFCPGGQTAFNSNNLNQVIQIPELIIPCCLISIENRKKIVKQSFLGRNGEFKTFIAQSDYDITIDAIIVASDDSDFKGSYNGIYPYPIIKRLDSISNAPCMIRIQNDKLSMLDINYVVINSYTMPEEEGSYSYQKVSISCQSDNASTYKSILSYNSNLK